MSIAFRVSGEILTCAPVGPESGFEPEVLVVLFCGSILDIASTCFPVDSTFGSSISADFSFLSVVVEVITPFATFLAVVAASVKEELKLFLSKLF